MSLSSEAIEKLFRRLLAVYGRAWTAQWDGVPVEDIKAGWAHELGAFQHNLQAIAWALENLPERVPNAIQFRNLCRQAPPPPTPRLPEPEASPEKVKEAIEKLRDLRNEIASKQGSRHWAQRIMTRYMGGERIRPEVLRSAKKALSAEPDSAE